MADTLRAGLLLAPSLTDFQEDDITIDVAVPGPAAAAGSGSSSANHGPQAAAALTVDNPLQQTPCDADNNTANEEPIDPTYGPTQIQAAKQRLALSKLLHERLGDEVHIISLPLALSPSTPRCSQAPVHFRPNR
jgi:hypothetical protein